MATPPVRVEREGQNLYEVTGGNYGAYNGRSWQGV